MRIFLTFSFPVPLFTPILPSCVVISKVLQTLFNLRSFAEDNKPETLALMRLNPFMEEYLPKVGFLIFKHGFLSILLF